jgi:BolA family transcriptional regulator, general stress-responsive regulator
MENRIRERLSDVFSPSVLEIVNESHMHHGHSGSPDTGESHFRVHIVSGRFSGCSRVERHRLVNDALAGELARGMHALAIRAEAPEVTA